MLMRRREFVGVLGAAAVWPLGARAQQANKLYRIGYLSLGSLAAEASRFNAFRAGLAALGYIEGKNLVIETRWLEGGKCDKLAELATQLVDLRVDVIVTYSTPGVSAAQRATTTIPIVFLTVGDAIAMGFVSSLARPGGNEFVDEGGLIAYSFDLVELNKRVANDIDAILRGANPGEIPYYQASKFELFVSLKTAKALGLTVPETLLASADKVIE
jgi:ABC-type uncharacterized transport system substrate-binding protein